MPKSRSQQAREAALDDFLAHAAEKFGELPQWALDKADQLLTETAARTNSPSVPTRAPNESGSSAEAGS